METARELFLHELKDMLDAEQQLVKALGEQAEESSRPDLKKAFASHQAQTEGHVERLQQAFQELAEQAEENECHGIRGLIQEHESFKEEDPSEELVDIFNVGAAIKVERYERSAYESLVRMAGELGEKKIARLLSKTLREEQQTERKMEAFSKKLKPEQLGVEAEEEAPGRRGARASSRRRKRAA
jgi:ferritin-like metal-binding protein YciE